MCTVTFPCIAEYEKLDSDLQTTKANDATCDENLKMFLFILFYLKLETFLTEWRQNDVRKTEEFVVELVKEMSRAR